MVVKEEADENRLINKMEQHLKRTLAEQQNDRRCIILIDLNALEYNGRKTSEFPFKVFVEVNDGLNIPQRKQKLLLRIKCMVHM